jgi:2-octaprenyl-6-methoxyphenol hydroxylase
VPQGVIFAPHKIMTARTRRSKAAAPKPEAPRAFDTVIVGGGLTGLTLAAALGQAGLSVAVIDRESLAAQTSADFDGRTTALSLGTKRLLEQVGVWAKIERHCAPILRIRIADKHSPAIMNYDSRDVGEEPFGFIIENPLLRAALHARAGEIESVTHLPASRIESIARGPQGVAVTLADGRTLRAPLLVGADGRHSFVRDWAEIETAKFAYGQTAIVTIAHHEKPHGAWAIEHFMAPGPFAVLPMTDAPDGTPRSSVVWTESNRAAADYAALPDNAFEAELQRRFGDYLGKVTAPNRRYAYPLSLQKAKAQIAERVALIGDAAHAIHPVAGQGLNLGMRDVASLAEILVDSARVGLDLGSAPVLKRYDQWRNVDTFSMVAATDGIVRLFSNESRILRAVRGIGLMAVERMPRLKRLFMRHAMGTIGDLPRLMRGEAL